MVHKAELRRLIARFVKQTEKSASSPADRAASR
jgi:hypothetical protein